MKSPTSIKVYNKEDKLKLLAYETESLKVINIHKYDGENMDRHSFTTIKKMHKANADKITYYDFWREIKGVMVERVYYTNLRSRHWEEIGCGEEIEFVTVFESGNVYETRTKKLDEGKYSAEFKNGEMIIFKFPIKENKINEYLKILTHGK